MTEGDVARTIQQRATVPPERRFAGWDGYEKLGALDEVLTQITATA
mgnify:CR=1 FL=1